MVVVFENYSRKQFLRIIFIVSKKENLCMVTEFWKTIVVLKKKKKKTCLVVLIKKFFRISKTKNIFESYFFQLIKCFLPLT